jgi:phage/plasmid-associated DNA primase
LHEIGKGESLNIGVLKAMTGNDAFFARTLHDKGAEVKPMFTLFMQCNDPPRIPESDEATWYRVRVVDYQSRFDENAPWDFEEQRKQNHFQADRHLDIASLASPLLWKLKTKYGKYKKTGLIEPKEVKISTQQYKTSNDVYQQFIDECLEKVDKKDSPPVVRWIEIQNTFRAWYKENHPSYSKDCPGKLEMKKQFVKRIGPANHQGRWVGYKINMGEESAIPPPPSLLHPVKEKA